MKLLLLALVLHLLLLTCSVWAFGPRAVFTVGSVQAKTSLQALRLPVQQDGSFLRTEGTKNPFPQGFFTLRTGTIVSYLLPHPVNSKTRRLGVMSEDGKIVPLCHIGGGEFVLDPSEQPLAAEQLRDNNLLLRPHPASRKNGWWLIPEYLDDDFYIPFIWDSLASNSKLTPSPLPPSSPSTAPVTPLLMKDSNVDAVIQQAEAQIQSLQSLVSELKSQTRGKVVHTDDAPVAVGPYSQAIKTNNLVFASGCIGLDPTTGKLVQGLEGQTRQALANLQAILQAAKTSFSNLAKTTIYLTSMADYSVVNKLYADLLRDGGCTDFPARTTIQVSALPLGALVEIDAVATC
eukprot:gene29099-35119_t